MLLQDFANLRITFEFICIKLETSQFLLLATLLCILLCLKFSVSESKVL